MPGAARDTKPAPDLRAPRILPHSALRFRLWRVRRGLCGRAGTPVPCSGPPPPGSWRSRESPATGARLPVALGARRLQSGREQWSRSWCPGGGAGGGLRPPPGVSRPCGPPLQTCGCSRFLQPGLHLFGGGGGRRRGVPDCSSGTVRPVGRPSDQRKVLSLRCFPAAARAHHRGRRGRRNALSKVWVQSGRCRPAPRTARAPPCAVAAPQLGLPLAAAGCRGRCTNTLRSAQSAVRRRGARLALSLSHSHPALVPPPPPPAAACWAL